VIDINPGTVPMCGLEPALATRAPMPNLRLNPSYRGLSSNLAYGPAA